MFARRYSKGSVFPSGTLLRTEGNSSLLIVITRKPINKRSLAALGTKGVNYTTNDRILTPW